MALFRVSLGLIATLLVALVFDVAVFGIARHERAQAIAHSKLVDSLARGEAPVGQLDGDGKLVSLGTPIARLEIPVLHLDLTVLEGTTSQVLADGPGHQRASVYPGQAGTSIIMGRQSAYGGDFGGLGSLRPGDRILVTTGQGAQHFTVTRTRHPGEDATAPAAGVARLTLVSATGTPFMAERTIWVDAQLDGSVSPTGPYVFGSSALSAEEQPMAGDMSAALPLFLWSQLLLIAALLLVWVRSVWGQWQTWLVAVPVLLLCCLQVAHSLAMYLPNLT